MKKILFTLAGSGAVLFFVAFTRQSLREQYAKPPAAWPAPWVDEGVQWTELALLPPGPLEGKEDSLRPVTELGKALFFDTRLSSSGKISCASCHQPELNWTDGRERSAGHNGIVGKRNAPTIQNSWFYHRLFWDGRARDLQDQAFAPIVSESEMNSEMPELMYKLRQIPGYRERFRKAFGSEEISPDRMTEAIAVFEKSVRGGESRFDLFLKGNKQALSNAALRGLHLFRTKARCFNCHHGPMLSDNLFHRTGTSFAMDSRQDKGLYNVTHLDADTSKFKTPSLRDVMRTGPWMHNGQEKNMREIIEHYHISSPAPGGGERRLGLTEKEKSDLLAFLKAITAAPLPFTPPVLPE